MKKKKSKETFWNVFQLKLFKIMTSFFFLLAIIAQHFNHNNNNHKIFVTSQAT